MAPSKSNHSTCRAVSMLGNVENTHIITLSYVEDAVVKRDVGNPFLVPRNPKP